MTKTELLKSLQERAESKGCKVVRKDIETIVDSLSEVLVDELKAERQATLPGLVKFVLANVAAKNSRQGRNPKTGEPVQIAAKPATTKLRARFLKQLKDEVSGVSPA